VVELLELACEPGHGHIVVSKGKCDAGKETNGLENEEQQGQQDQPPPHFTSTSARIDELYSKTP
jgi:hypothetical protein